MPSLKALIARVVNKILSTSGLEVRRRVSLDYHRNEAMIRSLEKIRYLGMTFSTVVDVGAAQGAWSLSADALWPSAKYVLFEPLIERKIELESLVGKKLNFTFAPYAAGDKDGRIEFFVSPDLDGSGIVGSHTDTAHIRTVDIRSVQDVVKENNLTGPFLIKLDTHGYEVPIIKGCETLMPDVSLFIIECYGFYIANQSLLFWEMCRHMDDLGFRLYDIVDTMNREKDGAFWQCDGFFLRKDHPLFSDNRYAK